MWELRRLTTLWAFTTCYRDRFFYLLQCRQSTELRKKSCRVKSIYSTNQGTSYLMQHMEEQSCVSASLNFPSASVHLGSLLSENHAVARDAKPRSLSVENRFQSLWCSCLEFYLLYFTELDGVAVMFCSCSGGVQFESQPGRRLFRQRCFVVFLSHSRKIPG
jgi:hypothetical protein